MYSAGTPLSSGLIAVIASGEISTKAGLSSVRGSLTEFASCILGAEDECG